jgi:hypothetical protein
MSNEYKYVIQPLKRWFKQQKANWKLYIPKYSISATGWDLQATRKNMDLLIEAKFVNGPFLASFTGLVTAPLANRPMRSHSRKYRKSTAYVCWAIGSKKGSGIKRYQILFDYFSRNLKFWRHYKTDLKMKYVFFIENDKVARITFDTLLDKVQIYYKQTYEKNLKLSKRRDIAKELMSTLRYF